VKVAPRTLLAVVALLLWGSVVATADAPPVVRCDLAGYQQHLQQLGAIVRACSEQKSATACDPGKVGPDNEVATAQATRLVHYGWLRQALADAAKSAALANKQGEAARGEIAAAALRLTQDSQSSPSEAAGAPIARVRGTLNSILSEHRFQRIQQEPNVLQRAWASLLNWIFERLNKVVAYGGENPWIAHILEAVAICVPCVLLTWWVMVRLRRQAALPRTAVEAAAPTAPSARGWQRWLTEAEGFAQEGRWREAVHHVYWAAISRLEAQGLWPADRARTPREYLRLLRAGHALESDLRGLTRSFELIWYGNRPAAAEQYREARARMEKLVPR
jgi:hypothetical protein